MNNVRGIVIDPGHGGEDPGSSGNGIVEKDLNLKISKYMYDRFKQLGIPVAITRSDDSILSPDERTRNILGKFGDSRDVIVISNHINAGGGDGAEVIYALRNNSNLSNLILQNIEKTGQNVRKAYQRRLPSDTSKDYYFIHRNTGITEPVIIEYGFLDSQGDDIYILKNNWQNLAESVVKAISEYTNTPYDIGINSYYVVKKGDTLWSIAKAYNTTVSEIKELNNLANNTLTIGQRLIISDIKEEIDDNYYVVKSGDTLYKLANLFNTTVDNIKSVNNLKNNLLNVGMVLTIPRNKSEILNNDNYAIYTVNKGDTLYKIANMYNVSVNDISKLNNLSDNVLSIGMQLKIPIVESNTLENTNDYISYTVKKGDSLYSIARSYNTSVNELMDYNNLNSNLLSIGQIIKIPINNKNYYIVKSGDTLYKIANQYGVDVDYIKKKNNLNSNLLSIGQMLEI